VLQYQHQQETYNEICLANKEVKTYGEKESKEESCKENR
jgi:hypothetical protein